MILIFETDTALQLALGNMDLHTLKQVNNFNPDRSENKKQKKIYQISQNFDFNVSVKLKEFLK